MLLLASEDTFLSYRDQLAEALSLFLPGSPFYDVLSALPPPDYTNPAATSTFIAQASIHNSLPILEELVAIYEKEEDTKAKIEIEKRRTRLGAPPLEQLRKDVALEIVSVSKVCEFAIYMVPSKAQVIA